MEALGSVGTVNILDAIIVTIAEFLAMLLGNFYYRLFH